jgi:hypothetical protein
MFVPGITCSLTIRAPVKINGKNSVENLVTVSFKAPPPPHPLLFTLIDGSGRGGVDLAHPNS